MESRTNGKGCHSHEESVGQGGEVGVTADILGEGLRR